MPLSQGKALLRLHLRRRRQDRVVRFAKISIKVLSVLLQREIKEFFRYRSTVEMESPFRLCREHIVYVASNERLAGKDQRRGRVSGQVLDRVGVEVQERFESLRHEAWIVAKLL